MWPTSTRRASIANPFERLKAEARAWLQARPADIWRVSASVRTNAMSGAYEDDMTAFFRRSPWEVSDADIWRWRAACEALRELRDGKG